MFPDKTLDYYRNRYLDHPGYNYKIYGLYASTYLKGMFVTRGVSNGSDSAIRVIDYFGKTQDLAGSYGAIQKFLQASKSEYLDLLSYGLAEEHLAQAGFCKLNHSNEDIIIPYYFEPLEQSNRIVNWAFKTRETEPFVLFKGDADQDRPNRL